MNAKAPKNSLLAAVAGNLAALEAEDAATVAAAPMVAESAARTPRTSPRTEKPGQGRAATVLVGGHFPPAVLQQLRILAAEEGTTNQALLGEALDLLFVKKGKGKIVKL